MPHWAIGSQWKNRIINFPDFASPDFHFPSFAGLASYHANVFTSPSNNGIFGSQPRAFSFLIFGQRRLGSPAGAGFSATISVLSDNPAAQNRARANFLIESSRSLPTLKIPLFSPFSSIVIIPEVQSSI